MRDQRAVGRTIGAVLLAVVPLALWGTYLVWRLGASGAGLDNFGLPFAGWWNKLVAIWRAQVTENDHALVISALLGHLALAVQAGYLVWRRDWSSPWWRLGAVYLGLMVFLGPAVWGEDLPGASVRVLLPVALAFNLTAVRHRAGWWWLAGGNLSVVGGVMALGLVQLDPRELSAGRVDGAGYVVRLDQDWHAVELGQGHAWAWCPREGTVEIRTRPGVTRELRIQVKLLAYSPGQLTISRDGQLLWRGPVGGEWQRINLPPLRPQAGRVRLDFSSDAIPRPEAAQPGARVLGFAVSDFRIDEQ